MLNLNRFYIVILMSLLSQSTISKEISLSGIGIHTGEKVNLKILPSTPKLWNSIQKS